MRSNIILVANRLPFSIQPGPDGLKCVASPGGMAAALGPVRDHYNARWVGWAGLGRTLHATEWRQLHLPDYAQVVDIPARTYKPYYHDVSNGSLWPILHGFAPRRMYRPADWQAYKAINQQFAEEVIAIAQPNDHIWIHDFHLFLLPGLLRQSLPHAKIGFFLHIPVSNPTLLESVPNWPEILHSLASSDLCGLQTTRDAQNLAQSFAAHGIEPPRLKPFPVGIDYQLFDGAHTRSGVRHHALQLGPHTAGKTLILSASRLDYTKGILEQLRAIDGLLATQPGRNIIFKLIVAPSREALTEYRTLKKQIETRVTDMQKRHAGAIQYTYRSMDFEEITAWYNRADIMFVAPLIDGMNLIAKEYVAARQQPGVLVLSRHAGAAEQLQEALQVDPTDTVATIQALKQAVIMSRGEQDTRHQALRHSVRTDDVLQWAEKFLREMGRAGKS